MEISFEDYVKLLKYLITEKILKVQLGAVRCKRQEDKTSNNLYMILYYVPKFETLF